MSDSMRTAFGTSMTIFPVEAALLDEDARRICCDQGRHLSIGDKWRFEQEFKSWDGGDEDYILTACC